MPKLSALPTGTPKLTDIVPGVDKAANATDQYTWQQVAALMLSVAYPVGYVITNTTGNNPGTELGFGTWVQYAKGRVLVGQDSSQTEFDVAEETGGEKTHQLTPSELASHAHGVSDPGHAHGVYDPGHSHQMFAGVHAGGGGVDWTNNGSNRGSQTLNWSDGWTTGGSGSNIGIYGSGTGISVNNTGADVPHNNLQPYQVVYFFKRTA